MTTPAATIAAANEIPKQIADRSRHCRLAALVEFISAAGRRREAFARPAGNVSFRAAKTAEPRQLN